MHLFYHIIHFFICQIDQTNKTETVQETMANLSGAVFNYAFNLADSILRGRRKMRRDFPEYDVLFEWKDLLERAYEDLLTDQQDEEKQEVLYDLLVEAPVCIKNTMMIEFKTLHQVFGFSGES